MISGQAVIEQITSQRTGVNLRKWAVPAFFALITVIVFASQTGGVGFQDKHHGWSSSHGLAIMSRATPENFFVGNARNHISESGFIGYIYFDRYPFFFSAFIGTLINLTDDLPTKVFIARQVMNIIFVLTMIFAYLLLNRLSRNPLLALSATLLAFSGYWLLYYRDMVHYDQPALLGMMILLYVIAVYKLERKTRWRWLYIATLVAVSLGRGYASFSILGLWFAAEAFGLLLQRDRSLWERVRAIVAHDATRAMILGLVWAGLMLGYNLVVEAARREVPIQYTSIVESAIRRLPFGYEDGRNLETAGSLIPTWDEFTLLTADRALRFFAPVRYPGTDDALAPLSPLLMLGVLAVVAVYILRQNPTRRLIALLMSLSGVGWVYFMINLTAQHDYTTMYLLGLALVFYIALVTWLGRTQIAAFILLVVSLGLFTAASQRVYAENIDIARAASIYTEDYNRILHAIEGSERAIYHTFPGHCAILNSKCYVLGFYLGDNYITEDDGFADYVLTSYIYHTSKSFLTAGDEDGLLLMAQSLTPQNTVAHLFDTASAEVRHLPEDIGVIVHFSDELSLNHWELRDSVTVLPCQSVRIESWWQMQNQPQANYSMQVAMVNSSGESVSASNTNLTTTPTRVWVPEGYFLDARSVQVPCDAPPGEYPLVMSVYDPDTVAGAGSLPVTLPDGTPFNDYVYLTTLFIEG